jgi:tetratricopeptide (TPR) repeat protein
MTDRFAQSELPRGSSGHMKPAFLAGMGEDAFSLARHGDELAQRGDRPGAIKLYRQALQAGGLDGATQQRLEKELSAEAVSRRQAGENLLRRGMLMEASREFRLLLDLDSKDEAVKASLKEIEQKLATKRSLINDIRSAIGAQQFEQAIAMWDRTPLDLREEGLAKQIEHLRTVIVPSVKLCEQGENYNGQGRLEEALSTFQDALRIDETCERARQGMGEVQGKLHRIELMLKEGYELSLKQDYARAVEAWKPILRLRPGHGQAIKSILESSLAQAQGERARGDLKTALKILGAARDVDPQNRGVGRLYEELQELSEKEQALMERAAEAASHGRTGEAIRYWHEVLRVNPPNLAAQERIRALGKERGKRLARISATVLVVSVLFVAGYQYLIEVLALSKVEECMREAAPDCETALTVLEETYFVYNRNEVPERRRRIKLLAWEMKAARYEEQGELILAANVLDQAAESMTDHAARLKPKATELRARDRIAKGDALLNLKEPDLAKARDEFEQGKRLAAQGQLGALVVPCDRGLDFIQKIEKALEHQRENRDAEYIRALQEAQALRPGNVFVKGRLDKSGYNAQQFDVQLKAATQALSEPWRPEALGEAAEALNRARAANPIGPRLEVLTRFAADARKCGEAGMVLVTNRKPENPDLTWLGGDRQEAFCIDRYESPNKAGALPEAGTAWLEAKARCEQAGKQLCSWRQWYKACGAKEFSVWTFGAKEIPGACNWGGPGGGAQVKPSGSFTQCRNQIGAFDMNGNLAEWTLDGAQENEAFQGGGSFNSGGPAAARCVELDRVSRPKTQGAPDAGFRCCKPLTRE